MPSVNPLSVTGTLALLLLGAATAWAVARSEALAPADEQTNIQHAAHTGPIEVDHRLLTLRANEGQAYHEDVLFTGIAVKWHDGGGLAERVAYVEGRKEGLTERWYPDGTLSYRATYRANRRHGTVKTWWEDATPRSVSRYVEGVADGVQRQWYRSGALFKEVNLKDGQETGLQRAWRENGKLYTNYEARDGRIFGLKRATLCYTLDDEALDINF